MTRFRAFDTVQIDASQIVDKGDYLLIKDVVACREIVQPYGEKKHYKPADELEKTHWTLDGRWAKFGSHPDSVLITRTDDINGRTVNPRYVKNLKDIKTKRPNGKGVLVDLQVFKKNMKEKDIDDIKAGKKNDVSIGFTYTLDETKGEWNGFSYDAVQREIFIDHLAFGIPKGRCPYPLCGIGADSVVVYEGLDPEVTENYVHIPVKEKGEFLQTSFRTVNISKQKGVKAVVGKLKNDPKGSTIVQKYIFATAKGWTMEKAKTWVSEHKGEDVDMSKAGDLTVAEINKKIKELKDSREKTRNDISGVYQKRQTEWTSVNTKIDEEWKKVAAKYDTEITKLYDQLSDIEDELNSYRQAKIVVLTNEASKQDEGKDEKKGRAIRYFAMSPEILKTIGDAAMEVFIAKLPALEVDEREDILVEKVAALLINGDTNILQPVKTILQDMEKGEDGIQYPHGTVTKLRKTGVCLECLDRIGEKVDPVKQTEPKKESTDAAAKEKKTDSEKADPIAEQKRFEKLISEL